jgi:glycosyltransferase involved in cell wall biosynthesis
MSHSDLTLVVPTYNRAALLVETLEYALRQTMPFHEIIVVDDGSTDDTAARLRRFEGAVRHVVTPNQGVQAARNRGVELAGTRYVALCDSDDLLLPDFVATVLPALALPPASDAVYSNFANFDAEHLGPDKFSQAPPSFFEGGLKDGAYLRALPDLHLKTLAFQPLFPSGMAFNKAFYQRLGGYDSQFKGVGSEDWEFCLRVCKTGVVTLCLPTLVHIRRHAGNDSASALHMNLGEAKILKHAAQTLGLDAQGQALFLATARQRLKLAFDAAFAKGDLALAQAIREGLEPGDVKGKARVKAAILAAPTPMRQFLWRLSQW